MAESTLSIGYPELRREVGRKLGYSRDPDNWGQSEVTDVDDAIKSGLRQFYNPPQHQWSFLKPYLTIETISGTGDYDLPDDFGYMEGDLTYVDSTTIYVPVRMTGPQEIYKLRQQLNAINQRPSVYAIKSEASDGTTGQRHTLLFFPIPQGVYELRGRYFALQSMLSESNPYPLGGAAHAETIRASCLAAAELMLDDERGNLYADFMSRLQASIEYDRRAGSEGALGYNGDGPTPTRIFRERTATYNGVIP